MPGLERETDILDASKRNSSQNNCNIDSVLPTIPLNVESIPNSDVGNLNISSSVILQESNKSKKIKY